MADEIADSPAECTQLILLQIVRLNRLTILLGVILAYVPHVPLVTTALFVVVLLAAAFGRRASLIYRLGTLVLKPSVSTSEGEDPRLMRFDNALAATFLGIAQLAFVLHASLVAWIVAGLAAFAAAVALAGICFGCFLFYHFKLNHARLFGFGTR
jgi:hypothetical protein